MEIFHFLSSLRYSLSINQRLSISQSPAWQGVNDEMDLPVPGIIDNVRDTSFNGEAGHRRCRDAVHRSVLALGRVVVRRFICHRVAL